MTFKLLTTAKGFFIDLVFPVKCVVCKKETERKIKNKLICTDCLKNLSLSLNFHCPLCEARTCNAKLCFSCSLIISNSENKFYLDSLLYPFSYKDKTAQKIIKAFKYQYIKDLEIPISRLMTGYLEKVKKQIDLDGFILVSTPLHKRKFNQRGYNQSELIVSGIAKYLNAETADSCLSKIKFTKDQASLKENRRLENLKGAFFCIKPWLISGRKIILVDDVYTTGATMQECARVLKEAGAKEVIGLAIARG
jgi:competence protein ComFC